MFKILEHLLSNIAPAMAAASFQHKKLIKNPVVENWKTYLIILTLILDSISNLAVDGVYRVFTA